MGHESRSSQVANQIVLFSEWRRPRGVKVGGSGEPLESEKVVFLVLMSLQTETRLLCAVHVLIGTD